MKELLTRCVLFNHGSLVKGELDDRGVCLSFPLLFCRVHSSRPRAQDNNNICQGTPVRTVTMYYQPETHVMPLTADRTLNTWLSRLEIQTNLCLLQCKLSPGRNSFLSWKGRQNDYPEDTYRMRDVLMCRKEHPRLTHAKWRCIPAEFHTSRRTIAKRSRPLHWSGGRSQIHTS